MTIISKMKLNMFLIVFAIKVLYCKDCTFTFQTGRHLKKHMVLILTIKMLHNLRLNTNVSVSEQFMGRVCFSHIQI